MFACVVFVVPASSINIKIFRAIPSPLTAFFHTIKPLYLIFFPTNNSKNLAEIKRSSNLISESYNVVLKHNPKETHMLKRILLTLTQFAIVTVILLPFAHADMTRMSANLWTTNFSNPDNFRLDVQIKVVDDTEKHPPNVVTSITINIPGGGSLDMDPLTTWTQNINCFFASFNAIDYFSGTIPSGRYSVTVEDSQGVSYTISDYVNANPILPTTMSWPPDGSTVSTTVTLGWPAVGGANYYRIKVWDVSGNQPIYWHYPGLKLHTNHNRFQFPQGVLQSGRNYRVRIEARTENQDLDRRSYSDWVNFSTN